MLDSLKKIWAVTLSEVKDYMCDYFTQCLEYKLPTSNICPYSSVTAQMVGYHLMNKAPFFS